MKKMVLILLALGFAEAGFADNFQLTFPTKSKVSGEVQEFVRTYLMHKCFDGFLKSNFTVLKESVETTEVDQGIENFHYTLIIMRSQDNEEEGTPKIKIKVGDYAISNPRIPSIAIEESVLPKEICGDVN